MKCARALIAASAGSILVACGSSASDSRAGISAKLEVSEFWVPAMGPARTATLTINGTAHPVSCTNYTAEPLVRVESGGARIMYRCGDSMKGGFILPPPGTATSGLSDFVPSCDEDWARVADWKDAPRFESSFSKLAQCTPFSRLSAIYPNVPQEALLGAAIGGKAVDDAWGVGFRAQTAEAKLRLEGIVATNMRQDLVPATPVVLQMLPVAGTDFVAAVARAIDQNAGAKEREQHAARQMLRALVVHEGVARATACTNLHTLGDTSLHVLSQTHGPSCESLEAEILSRADWLCDGLVRNTEGAVATALAGNGGPGSRIKDILRKSSYALVADQNRSCTEAKAGQLCRCPVSFCESQVNGAAAENGCAFVVNEKAKSIRVVAASH